MAGLTLSAADAVLKEDYHGPVAEQLNNGNILLAIAQRNTEDFAGRRFITPAHISRNSGVGARAESGTLPAAGNQGYVDLIGPVRYNYARIQLTGPAIAAMSKSRGAFITALDSEMSGAVNDSKRDITRQLWGESNGRLATCGTTTTSATVVLATATREDQYRALEEGFLVDIGTLANPTSIASARSVTSVDRANHQIVISGATVSTTSAAFVFRSGAGGASSNSGNPGDGQKEWTGLQTMIDDTAVLHTVDPSTVPKWKAVVDSNSGTNRTISENIVNKNQMDVEVKSGQVVDLLLGSDGVFRSYANLLVSLKRFTDTVELAGGYTGVGVGLTPQKGTAGSKTALAWDRDATSNRLYGLSSKSFNFLELQDWEWIDGTNGNLLQITDQDVYNATMSNYSEFVCRQRDANFVIKDITES